jgi:hypothetical protein
MGDVDQYLVNISGTEQLPILRFVLLTVLPVTAERVAKYRRPLLQPGSHLAPGWQSRLPA